MVIGALDLVAVGLLVLLDEVEVRSQQGFGRVAFGGPLNWITQDQALDPPFSHSASIASPWENPTAIDWLPLVVNLVVVGLVLAVVWRGVLVMLSRCSTE